MRCKGRLWDVYDIRADDVIFDQRSLMKLAAAFEDSLEDSYYHLKKNVQLWCVSAERQVKIFGEDAAKFVQLMTCRDLSKSKVGKCYYAPLIDDQGFLVNDTIINKLA